MFARRRKKSKLLPVTGRMGPDELPLLSPLLDVEGPPGPPTLVVVVVGISG